MPTSLIANEIDVLLLSERKLDETFPLEQFLISGFAKPLRLDRNSKGGDIMLFIRDNIPSRLLKPGNLPSNTEAFFIEINVRKKKWLMCCGYNPNKSLINKFTHDIGKVLDSFIGNYDNFLIVGDLNSEIGESSMYDFCNIYNLHSLCHKSTCYKNPEKPSRIDLFLTNSPKSFQNTQTIETGLSDFHKLVVTILKMYLPNNQPKVITYRDYKNFNNSRFSEELLFDDPIIAATHKYKIHPSILKIKEQLKKYDLFSFYHVNPDKMLKIIENIDSKKATQHGDIPVRIIKENKFIFSKVLSEIFNFYIDNNTFPNGLKMADINPVYKKDDPFDKTNYRPISILPVLSKPFERCLYDKIYEYIDTVLSKAQCGFRKGFSTQYSLIAMTEKWRKNMDKGKSFAALLTDLSKAFDCIVHDFLIAKLEAYGFSYEALKVIYNYLTDRKHRTKVNNSFSDFVDVLLGVSQG